jgi:hypothetical protein
VRTIRRSFVFPCEQNEVSVRIADDKRARAPRLRAERLMKRDAGRFKLEVERLGIFEDDREFDAAKSWRYPALPLSLYTTHGGLRQAPARDA